MTATFPSIFKKLDLSKDITLRNRIVMAPMTTWSANPDGTVSEEELAFYRRRATGAGMILTGCTHVMPNGIGFTDEFAAHDDRFIPSLRQLAEAAKSGGAPAILQIFHAGIKALPDLIPKGDIVSASQMTAKAGSFTEKKNTSRALSEEEIHEVINAFGEATRRAIEAGFDGVELHGAHGFLIQNFFSPLFNQRDDQWGGNLENRMRFPLALVEAVKKVITSHADRPFIVGFRVSPEEPEDGGLRVEDTCVLIDHLIENGVDYIHASLMDIENSRPIGAKSAERTVDLISKQIAGRVPLIAAGNIRTPLQAENVLKSGLSLVAVGKGLVINPDWVELAATDKAEKIDTSLDKAKVPQIDIPQKLWEVIKASVGSGWFPVNEPLKLK